MNDILQIHTPTGTIIGKRVTTRFGYLADSDGKKYSTQNLEVGAYRTEDGRYWLRAARKLPQPLKPYDRTKEMHVQDEETIDQAIDRELLQCTRPHIREWIEENILTSASAYFRLYSQSFPAR